MSDLAAPLLVVFVSESEAFAAFNTLMSRVGGNFDAEQKGMHAQLAALRRIIQVSVRGWRTALRNLGISVSLGAHPWDSPIGCPKAPSHGALGVRACTFQMRTPAVRDL